MENQSFTQDSGDYRKIDMKTAWNILPQCWKWMEVDYLTTLSLGFLCLLVSMTKVFAGFFLGALTYAPLMLISTLACLWASRSLEKEKREPSLQKMEWFSRVKESLLQATRRGNIEKILPLMGLAWGLSVFGQLLMNFKLSILDAFFLQLMVELGETALCLAAALILFEKNLHWKSALIRSLHALGGNAAPLAFLFLLYLSTFLLCVIFFVFPIFFIFYPLSVTFMYVIYTHLFEEQEPEDFSQADIPRGVHPSPPS